MELQKRIKKKLHRNWKLAYTHYVCKDGFFGITHWKKWSIQTEKAWNNWDPKQACKNNIYNLHEQER